ncbi:hypothetical protein BZA70DRAFT_277703 [Myxozyma melibiosi]|uniref:Uncharacterized protein n=1 Tax=Myxozyma melibiosi TaxID=54550 RepID=A0ABR1FA26_9ASCO
MVDILPFSRPTHKSKREQPGFSMHGRRSAPPPPPPRKSSGKKFTVSPEGRPRRAKAVQLSHWSVGSSSLSNSDDSLDLLRRLQDTAPTSLNVSSDEATEEEKSSPSPYESDVGFHSEVSDDTASILSDPFSDSKAYEDDEDEKRSESPTRDILPPWYFKTETWSRISLSSSTDTVEPALWHLKEEEASAERERTSIELKVRKFSLYAWERVRAIYNKLLTRAFKL